MYNAQSALKYENRKPAPGVERFLCTEVQTGQRELNNWATY